MSPTPVLTCYCRYMTTPLSATHPELMKQFHPDNDRDPDSLTAGSSFRALWVCARGHTWRTAVCNRTGQSTNCPYCTNRKVWPGFNDLATTHPEVAALWHPDNPDGPDSRTATSHTKVRWRCGHGHEWTRAIFEVVQAKSRCQGCRSLGFLHPELASELVRPEDAAVSAGSNKRVEWRCGEGHTWKTPVASRTLQGTGCPYCVGKRATADNRIAGTHPHLVSQTAEDISAEPPSSVRRVVWNCASGHSWEASISSRAKQGSGCPYCSGRRPVPGVSDLATVSPSLTEQWSDSNLRNPEQVSAGSDFIAEWVCPDHGTWDASVKNRALRGQQCPQCAENSRGSRLESEVVDYVGSVYGGRLFRGYRGIPGVHEVDAYLPDLQLAVEVNGVYWHSEAGSRMRLDHRNKRRALDAAGVRLIVVWEDDWRDRPEVVRRFLDNQLGVDSSVPVGARKCTVDESVPRWESDRLLEGHHLQGPTRSRYRVGLRYGGELVAVATATVRGGVLSLERFATSRRVPGGFTRLLSRLRGVAREEGCSRIVTFADLAVSDGGLYRKSGFVAVEELAPDYSYLVDARRKHKFGYRLERFRRDPELVYAPGLSESQLAALNGLHRVWDYGKVRWELPV